MSRGSDGVGELRAGFGPARRGLRPLLRVSSSRQAPVGSGGREAWDESRRGQRARGFTSFLNSFSPADIGSRRFMPGTCGAGLVAGILSVGRRMGGGRRLHTLSLEREKENKNKGKKGGGTEGETKRKERKRERKRKGKKGKERGQGWRWALPGSSTPGL